MEATVEVLMELQMAEKEASQAAAAVVGPNGAEMTSAAQLSEHAGGMAEALEVTGGDGGDARGRGQAEGASQ